MARREASLRPCRPINRSAIRRKMVLASVVRGGRTAALREEGVLIGIGGPMGNVVRVQPPPVCCKADLERARDAIEQALARISVAV